MANLRVDINQARYFAKNFVFATLKLSPTGKVGRSDAADGNKKQPSLFDEDDQGNQRDPDEI